MKEWLKGLIAKREEEKKFLKGMEFFSPGITKQVEKKKTMWRVSGILMMVAEITLIVVNWKVGVLVFAIMLFNNMARNQSRQE